MLGTVDESHIIRTIEYWDIERQRYPSFDHQAVIVAEEITSRFFNVIRLLNRAVPIIAIQLNALTVADVLVLHFTKVLDVLDVEDEGDDSQAEQADRAYWERQSNPASLAIADRVLNMVPSTNGPAHVTYNRGHIAVGTVGYNFCWLHPRRTAPHCPITLRLTAEGRDAVIQQLNEASLSASAHRRHEIKVVMTSGKELDDQAPLLRHVIAQCEEASRH
jgi:hypothetical protein